MNIRNLLLAMLPLVSASCGQDPAGVAGVLLVTQVEITPGTASLPLGGSLQLIASPRTASGIDVPGRAVVWTTSDESLVTVSSTGMIEGRGIGGPVRITAAVGGVEGEASVTVAGDHLVVATSPSSTARSGTNLAVQPVIRLINGAGAGISRSNIIVTATLEGGVGVLSGDRTRETDGSGYASFTNLRITGTGIFTLRFSAPGYSGTSSASITVTP